MLTCVIAVFRINLDGYLMRHPPTLVLFSLRFRTSLLWSKYSRIRNYWCGVYGKLFSGSRILHRKNYSLLHRKNYSFSTLLHRTNSNEKMPIHTRWKIYSVSRWIKLNFYFKSTFPIAMAPNRIQLGAKLIGKVQLQSKFGLIRYNKMVNLFLCMYRFCALLCSFVVYLTLQASHRTYN